jgi:broad specificity phosphatase PhoE
MGATLYLVRHAEASGAADDDPGLTPRGREQARALGARLAAHRVAAVWHGPRRRAAETAELLAEELGDVPSEVSPLLEDRTPVPSADRRGGHPPHLVAWFDDVPAQERDPDGAALSAAFGQLRREAHRLAAEGALVVVTHAFVIGWFVREVLEGPAAQWLRLAPANAGLTVVGWRGDGRGVLHAFNDTGHLG